MRLRISLVSVILSGMAFVTPGQGGILVEGFDDLTALAGRGWTMTNRSDPVGPTNWFQGNSAEVFPAYEGAPDAYTAANFNNTTGIGTISNWLITPTLVFGNGDSMTFYTRTVALPQYADRLEVRFSDNGTSSDVGFSSDSVGDFAELLLEVNPSLTLSGYPSDWTAYAVNLSGLSGPVEGRLAFRYFVTDAGPLGANGDYIGIDSVTFEVASIPEPSTMILAAAGFAFVTAVARARRQSC